MARIAGVDLPKKKRGCISLTYIYGVGRTKALQILETTGVGPNVHVSDWTDENISKSQSLFKMNILLRVNYEVKFKQTLSV